MIRICYFFVSFFRDHYHRFDSLEDAFLLGSQVETGRPFMENALNEFKAYFFPNRTIRFEHVNILVHRFKSQAAND